LPHFHPPHCSQKQNRRHRPPPKAITGAQASAFWYGKNQRRLLTSPAAKPLDEKTIAIMTEIYLLRHGDTGVGEVLAGATDLPLAAAAYAGLEPVGRLLAAIRFDHIWCSPRLRCRQTLAAALPGAKAEIAEDLREIDFGRWEMRAVAAISAEYPEEAARLAAWDETFTFPGGESIASFLARVAALRARVMRMAPAKNDPKILMITHGGVIRQLLCGWLGIPSRHYLLFAVKPGKITTLSIYEDGGVLTGLNLA
jgi:broad specificity phosphatase PhoE